ncbi:internal (core) protein B [Yersinia phage fPS-59]|uniref:Internal virion protein gp14 n=1 Tax=Yersinia phage fPS-59 TaxID=2052754 RepID=A0A2D0PEL5_9CAUD|nr:internal virion protein [Yersinia phage fPS-59]SOO46824.1 internal (core) protein B [Yersinia phage fPS-59]
MCWMAAIPIAMSVASSVAGGAQADQAAAAKNDMLRRQQRETIKAMNIEDANLKLEQRDLLDSTVNELTQGNMNRVRNMGTMRAAIGESMLEGQSIDRVERVTEGDFLREQAGVTENYQRDYASILGKRYGNREQALSTVDSLKAQETKSSSGLSKLLDPLGIATSGIVGGMLGGNFKGNPVGQKAAKITAAKGTANVMK